MTINGPFPEDMGHSHQQTNRFVNRKRKRNDVIPFKSASIVNTLAENFKKYPNLTSEIKSEEHFGPSEPKKNNSDISKIHHFDHDYLKKDFKKMTFLNGEMHNLDEDGEKEIANLHREYGSKVVGDIMQRLQNILKRGKSKTLSENIVDGTVDESINRNPKKKTEMTKLADMPDNEVNDVHASVNPTDLQPALQLILNILSSSLAGKFSNESSTQDCESIVNNCGTVTQNDGMGNLDSTVSSASNSKSEFVMRSSYYNSELDESTINPTPTTTINSINLLNMATSAITTSASSLPSPSYQSISKSQSRTTCVVAVTTSDLVELECAATAIEVEKGTTQHSSPFVTTPAKLSNQSTIVNSSTTIMSPEEVSNGLAAPTTATITNINVMDCANSNTSVNHEHNVISHNQNMTACIPVSTAAADVLEQNDDIQGFVSSRSLSSSFPFQPYTTKSSSAAITFADHPLLIRGPAIYENMDIRNAHAVTIKDKVATSKPLLVSSNVNKQSAICGSRTINLDKYDSYVELVESYSPEKNNFENSVNDSSTESLQTTSKPLWVTSGEGKQINACGGIEVHGKGNGHVELIVECSSPGKNDLEDDDKEYSFMKYIERSIEMPNTCSSLYGFCDEINDPEKENIDMLQSSKQYCDAENMLGDSLEYNVCNIDDKYMQMAEKQSAVQSNPPKNYTREKNNFVPDVITIEDDDNDEYKYNLPIQNIIPVSNQDFSMVDNCFHPVGDIIQERDKTYRNLNDVPLFEDTDSYKNYLFSDEEKSLGSQSVGTETDQINTSLNTLLHGLNAETSCCEYEDLDQNLKQDVHMVDPGIKDIECSTGSPKQCINESTDTSEDYVDQKTWYKSCVQNLCLQDQDGDTILHITIAKEDIRAISLINRMDKHGLDIKNKLGQTALHLACYVHNIHIIEALLSAGADVDIVDRNGNSPLHIACEEKSISMVNCFMQFFMRDRIKLKKLMHICNNQGLTAIHIATQKREVPIVKCLLENGCSLDTQDQKSGATVLVYSLMNSDKELTRLFIDGKAEINTPTFSGHYPLHYAAQAGDIEFVKELVGRGAEIGNKLPEFPADHPDSHEMKGILEKELRKRRRRKKRNESKLQQYD